VWTYKSLPHTGPAPSQICLSLKKSQSKGESKRLFIHQKDCIVLMNWSPHHLIYIDSIPVAISVNSVFHLILFCGLLARQGKALWETPEHRVASIKTPWVTLGEQWEPQPCLREHPCLQLLPTPHPQLESCNLCPDHPMT
jgi:hypothetical protein